MKNIRKVNIFSAIKKEQLEHDINVWVEKHQFYIISASLQTANEENEHCFVALVVYEERD